MEDIDLLERPDDDLAEPAADDPQITLQRQLILLQKLSEQENVISAVDPERLPALGDLVVREYKIDKDSRAEWEKCARRAMRIAKQDKDEKTTPWAGASNVKYPMLTTAALQFAARAYPAIIDGPRVVKCQVVGRDDTGMKAGQADRVSQHMSHQLLVETPEWESDVDTMLHQIPIIGCAFKKVYRDSTKVAGFGDDLISAFDLVVNQGAKSLESVPRSTHVFTLYPHEIDERMRDGRFREVDLKALSEGTEDSAAETTLLEQHRYWDMDGDGMPEPWIITVHEKTMTVLRIRANYDSDRIIFDTIKSRITRIPRRDYYVLIPFIPDPEGGFYPIGFGKLLEAVSDVIDTTINQMMDAGTLQNSGGGFIGSGLQLGNGGKSSKTRITMAPGEYKVVSSPGNDIRGSIVHMEHPGPSTVLFQLLGMMIEACKDIASIQDILVGDSGGKVQTATTTMAMIEQGLKVFTAIYKRIFRALKREYKLIFDINKKYLDRATYVALLDEPIEVTQMDYADGMAVMPVADPNLVTDMQRLSQAQFLMEQVQAGNPHVNGFEATKRALMAARIDNAEQVLVPPPPPDQPPPPSPEEQMAQAKIADIQARTEAAAAQAQIKQQSAMMDLDAKGKAAQLALQGKQADLMMQLEAKQRDMEMRAVEAEEKHVAQLRALQLQSDQLDQKWRELQLREEHVRMKAEEAAVKRAGS